MIIESESIVAARSDFRSRVLTTLQRCVEHAAIDVVRAGGNARIVFPHIGSKSAVRHCDVRVQAQCEFVEKWFLTSDGIRFVLRQDWLRAVARTADDFTVTNFESFLAKRIYVGYVDMDQRYVSSFSGSLWTGGVVSLDSGPWNRRWGVECRLVWDNFRFRVWWSCSRVDDIKRVAKKRKRQHELVNV